MMETLDRPEIEETAASEAARALNAMRRIVRTNCRACGQEIEGVVQRKWCDNRCAKRGERMRIKERKAAVSRYLRH